MRFSAFSDIVIHEHFCHKLFVKPNYFGLRAGEPAWDLIRPSECG